MDLTSIFQFLNKSIGVFNIRGISIEPTYWMAGTIIFLAFLLLLTLARLRYLYIHWSLNRPALSFLFYGFLLALILEGFFIIGGKTILTEIIGWKNAPKPISTLLDLGREKLVQVLGVSQEIPSSIAKEEPTLQTILENYQKLSTSDRMKVQDTICKP